jgi:hypothetical protein
MPFHFHRHGLFRFGAPLVVALLVLAGASVRASAAESLLPELAGSWTAPFEEGGADTPRCVPSSSEKDPDGFVVCKPVAQGAAVLPDGRVFYFNGIDGLENSEEGFGGMRSIAPSERNSQVRILDLRSGTPVFDVPAQERGGQTNPNIKPGHRSYDDPLGALGVPGRPGDGFVGTVAGMAGVPEHAPTSPPDDASDNDGDMFCGDLTSLADGRVLVAGGTDWYNEPAVMDRNEGDPADVGASELEGLRNVNLFDPETNSFQSAAPMKYGRWYPGLVELADGKVFVASGVTQVVSDTQLSQVRRTETYDPDADRWDENYVGAASENTLPAQPRLVLAPNGKVYYAAVGQMWGPFNQAVDEALYAIDQFFDPQTKQWEVVGLAPLGARSGASVTPLVMKPPYDQMTLLTFGGTLGPPPGTWVAVPFSTLTTIGATGRVAHEMTANLNHARWFPSGVLLPDGKVLAVGGADKDEVIDPGMEIPVHVPELYDPATGTWTPVAAHARDRVYHNSAVLLPDMRVLLGSHTPLPAHYSGPNRDQGRPFANNDKDSSFEVWSPPYLFRGERPRITRAPAGVAYGHRFSLGTPRAAGIESVLLIKPQSAQHVNDADQRALELSFTVTGDGTLEVVAPPDGVAAPPGYYYLVVNRRTDQGPVPSVARMVRVGGASDPAEATQPFPDDAPAPARGSATADLDSSRSAETRERLGAATQGQDLPAPAPGPEAVEKATPADSRPMALAGSSRSGPRPVDPLPLAAMGVVAVAAGNTGRRWTRSRRYLP